MERGGSMTKRWAAFLALGIFLIASSTRAENAVPTKEWTLLIFLNGNNSLEQAAYDDIREMERVVQDDRVNVVVQFAALHATTTNRVLISRNTTPYSAAEGVQSYHSTVLHHMPV